MKRLHDKLKMKFLGKKVPLKVIRLIDPQVDENQVLGSLLPFLDAQYWTRPMIFHFDVTSSVSAPGFQMSGCILPCLLPRIKNFFFLRVLTLSVIVSKNIRRGRRVERTDCPVSLYKPSISGFRCRLECGCFFSNSSSYST